MILPEPAGCGFRMLAADADALYVTGTCGLGQIAEPGAPTPLFVPLATGNLGAVTVASGFLWAVDADRGRLLEYDRTGPAIAAVPLDDGPTGVVAACPRTPAGVAGDLFVNNVDGVLDLVDLHHRGAVSVVAARGLHGGDLTCGADGQLYVTQAGRIQRVRFGPAAGPAAGAPGRDPVYPLVLSAALLLVTIAGLLWVWAARRRRAGWGP
jgi:hypothetical protein